MSFLDKHQFAITCPACGKGFRRAAGRLNKARSLRCPGCATRLVLNKKNFGLLDRANAVLAVWARLQARWRGLPWPPPGLRRQQGIPDDSGDAAEGDELVR